MRTAEEIKADMQKPCGYTDKCELEFELRNALIFDIPLDRLEAICAAEKDGRLAVLPKGKIGDVVEWNSGVSTQAFEIQNIIVCRGGVRYDLDEFVPFADDEHICRIIPRAEAEAALKGGAE